MFVGIIDFVGILLATRARTQALPKAPWKNENVFEGFSELRKSYELRFGQQASIIKSDLKIERSYVDFQYFGRISYENLNFWIKINIKWK